jgi:hypothetical protein
MAFRRRSSIAAIVVDPMGPCVPGHAGRDIRVAPLIHVHQVICPEESDKLVPDIV